MIVSDYEEIFARFSSVFAAIKREFRRAEAVVVSTCLRYEILVSVPGLEGPPKNAGAKKIKTRLARYFADILKKRAIKVDEGELYYSEGPEAVRHLFSVMSGFESEDIGEIQVLGQIKDSYKRCREAAMAGETVNRIYGAGLKCVIKVRNMVPVFTDRNILKKNILKKLHGRFGADTLAKTSVMIAGAGRLASDLAATLRQLGTAVKLIKLTSEAGPEEFKYHDILIFDFADMDFCVGLGDLEESGGKKTVIDLSISRNVPPEAASLENVELITIEELITAKWKEGERVGKRRDIKGFYEQARSIVARDAKAACADLSFALENDALISLMREMAETLESEFEKSSKGICAKNYIKKIDGLKNALIKKIPSLVKRRLLK
jgi:glutamyl-tRNA reductase